MLKIEQRENRNESGKENRNEKRPSPLPVVLTLLLGVQYEVYI